MTKAEVITEIAKKTGIEKADVSGTVEAFLKVVRNSLVSGENVYIRGFGSFILKKKAEKVARNISREESIVIPAHYAPSFKPSKRFIKAVKEKIEIQE